MSDANEKVLIFAFRELRIDRKRTTEGKGVGRMILSSWLLTCVILPRTRKHQP